MTTTPEENVLIVLVHSAAYDKIAARPRNRKPRRKGPQKKRTNNAFTFSEIDDFVTSDRILLPVSPSTPDASASSKTDLTRPVSKAPDVDPADLKTIISDFKSPQPFMNSKLDISKHSVHDVTNIKPCETSSPKNEEYSISPLSPSEESGSRSPRNELQLVISSEFFRKKQAFTETNLTLNKSSGSPKDATNSESPKLREKSTTFWSDHSTKIEASKIGPFSSRDAKSSEMDMHTQEVPQSRRNVIENGVKWKVSVPKEISKDEKESSKPKVSKSLDTSTNNEEAVSTSPILLRSLQTPINPSSVASLTSNFIVTPVTQAVTKENLNKKICASPKVSHSSLESTEEDLSSAVSPDRSPYSTQTIGKIETEKNDETTFITATKENMFKKLKEVNRNGPEKQMHTRNESKIMESEILKKNQLSNVKASKDKTNLPDQKLSKEKSASSTERLMEVEKSVKSEPAASMFPIKLRRTGPSRNVSTDTGNHIKNEIQDAQVDKKQEKKNNKIKKQIIETKPQTFGKNITRNSENINNNNAIVRLVPSTGNTKDGAKRQANCIGYI